MLSRSHTLSSKEVRSVFKKSRRLSSPLFTLLYSLDTTTHSYAKFSVVVSKKVARKAVTRNKLKRRMNSALSEVVSGFRSGKYVFVLKKPFTYTSFKDVREEIQNIEKALNNTKV